MAKLQLRSEFHVSKALKIPGSSGKAMNESMSDPKSFEAASSIYSSNHIGVSPEYTDIESPRSDGAVPSWCYPAFQFEKMRKKREATDWDFVVPVWIAITLFCTLVQVVAFKSLAYFL